ncbi:MAG: bifunctional folylpolyglutamate synthase/dihydrofolate synthase [Prolixibacteraceae bacterium]|jgi:dihydrofolate synthase/folylpolyglutamate synthase|nr:bifunctional folylpolyglutamate synthase/dihydrofolate synthase [Prolixibacteraceae bacterium]
MDYNATLEYLYKQLPMYQRSGVVAYKNNLDNTLALDEQFNHPHKNFKSIHVAGTNGKGSVAHMLASILQSEGFKVGLYTSPHLKDYRERIRVNGEMISENAVTDFVSRFQELNKNEEIKPSFFELSVTMAFDYFSSQEIDIAVVEVGLGGRLDSTNVITPEVSVITNISLDHTNLLGNSLSLIAAEKAGIIKPNVTVVIGETDSETAPVFIQKAEQEKAAIVFADQKYSSSKKNNLTFSIEANGIVLYSEIDLELKGNYQQRNLITCIAVIDQLIKQGFSISENSICDGLKDISFNTGLAGRWQQIGQFPKIICDTGHNESGIELITNQLKVENYKNLHIVFGTVNDKNIEGILRLLPSDALYYFTQAKIDRAMDANILNQLAVKFKLKGNAYFSVTEALEKAKSNAGSNDLIFVGGSTFVVAEVI